MRSMSLLGWVVTVIVIVIIWQNAAAAGVFFFHSVPDHISEFFRHTRLIFIMFGKSFGELFVRAAKLQSGVCQVKSFFHFISHHLFLQSF